MIELFMKILDMLHIRVINALAIFICVGASDLTLHAQGYTFYGATPTLYTTSAVNVSVSTTPISPMVWTGTTTANNTIYADLYDVTNGQMFNIKGIITTTYNLLTATMTN